MRRLNRNAGLLVVCLAAVGCSSGDVTDVLVDVSIVRVTPSTRQIARSETTTFTAEALDSSGNVLTGRTFTFTSSNSNVATIADQTANPATVTAVAPGVVAITATTEGGEFGSVEGSATLTVTGLPDIQVTGRVVDAATGLGIPAAMVDYSGGFAAVRTAVTGANGVFSILIEDDGAPDVGFTWQLRATKSGYVSTTLSIQDPNPPSTQVEDIVLVPQTSVKGTISGTVRNARTNQPIPGITVHLRTGQGIPTGADVAEAVSSSNGGFSFTQLDAGTYTLFAQSEGYQQGTRTAVTLGGGATVTQDLILSPVGSNLVVIVLTWGSSPSDLDSHLTGPNTDASRFHVYYANRGSTTAAPRAALDVDDTSSFGPETITISQFNSGVYRYSVHDFSNRNSASSAALGVSGARVQLYAPGANRSYFVPNQPGTLWTVFELSGNIASPTITERNSMSVATEPAGILSPPAENSTGPTSEPGRVLVFRDRLASFGGPGNTDAGLIGRTIRTFPKALQR